MTEDIVRTEHVFPTSLMRDSVKGKAAIEKKAAELRAKLIKALQDDGYIESPSNVIHVDFKRRKRA